jgi:hypothetical protein
VNAKVARPGRLALAVLHAGADLRLRVTGTAGPPPLRAPGPFTTCVARLPPAVAEPLCRAVAEAMGAAGAPVVYPPDAVHVTIANLDRATTGDLPASVAEWADAQAPLRARVAGIGYSRATAFAALDLDESALRAARRALRRTAGAPERRSAALRDRVGAANLARFERPLGAEAGRALTLLRSHGSAPFTLAGVELVRTDKVLSATGTEILGSYALRGGDHMPPREST